MKDKILELRSQGKNYKEIALALNCSKSTVSYHCGQDQKEKTRKRVEKKRSKQNPITKKTENFRNRVRIRCEHFQNNGEENYKVPTFKPEDVREKFGESPECYLTGRKISWENSESYAFDHVTPTSKGGDNSLENLGLCHPDVNRSKHALSVEEFISLCKEVLEYNGYLIKLPR